VSLGIAFKGPEGIVLAADSRVTLLAQQPGLQHLIPATFDNATKLLKVASQSHVGAVTYGLGALGTYSPRTAHSFLPEFEAELAGEVETGVERLSVVAYASKLSAFFMNRWTSQEMPSPDTYVAEQMIFLVGGYDDGEAYGRVYEFFIPGRPEPVEQNPGSFGVTWGGQLDLTSRVIQGFDPRVPDIVARALDLDDDQRHVLTDALRPLQLTIPYPFLPLQDCVDLSILLIRMTIELQAFYVGIRGVGGAIDVASITRTEGYVPVQEKKVRGEERRR
jgi:hypothetical protein